LSITYNDETKCILLNRTVFSDTNSAKSIFQNI